MGKKILKRSLTLGVMMVFVITGNVWAENCNKFSFINDIKLVGGHYIPNFNYGVHDKNLKNIVLVNNPYHTDNGTVMIYANFKINRNEYRYSNVIKGNVLDINNNLTCGSHLELFGCAVNKEFTKVEVSKNIVNIIGEGNTIVLKTKNDEGEIHISGGMTNDGYYGAGTSKNEVNIDNVSFLSGEVDGTSTPNVYVKGGEGRSGYANDNKVVIKNSTITKGRIEGGYAYSDADNNVIILGKDSIIKCEVYGGRSITGIAKNNTINLQDNADVSKARLYGRNDTSGTGNTLNIGWDFDKKQSSAWSGKVGLAQNFNVINVCKGSDVTFVTALNDSGTTVNLYSSTWNVTPKEDGAFQVNKVGALNSNDGRIVFHNNGHLDVDGINVNEIGNGEVIITEAGKTADNLNTASQLTTVAEKMGVAGASKETTKVKVVMEAGDIVGKTVGEVVFEEKDTEGEDVTYYHGVVKKVTEEINSANKAVSDAGISLKLHYRYHMNDMNKRMGELRNANGEYGVWTRMVRGECEYENTNAQYNQYQLGYDKKLSADKRWTVGAAVTFSDGNANYGFGSTEDKSTAFAVYGSKLNDNGTFVDLIARYVRLESDITDISSGKGDYSTDGMSVSAEFGKRIQKGNGFWIEPQVELTYGTIDSAEFKIDSKNVHVGKMDSLISRVGFSLGKDIKQGNVYARASYLYDFDGETENIFSKGSLSRTIKEDLGGGWWEVGVGANINLSKATYIYADVEKAFGGAVDTNWQWNLGVRYSF